MQRTDSTPAKNGLDAEAWAILLELEREKQRRDQYGERPFLELPLPQEREEQEEPSTGGNVVIISI
ncbi:MAG: hypothetical protein GY822_10275 [Deltaproteobacteria bacterium]|nr:hypothetical protein [Deltaproteobacteria bacterium]